MSIIEFRGVNKFFGDFQVLKDIDFTVDEGEVVVVIGPSGSGKSTLLRCINGLEEITSGELVVDGMQLHNAKYEPQRAAQRDRHGLPAVQLASAHDGRREYPAPP